MPGHLGEESSREWKEKLKVLVHAGSKRELVAERLGSISIAPQVDDNRLIVVINEIGRAHV